MGLHATKPVFRVTNKASASNQSQKHLRSFKKIQLKEWTYFVTDIQKDTQGKTMSHDPDDRET